MGLFFSKPVGEYLPESTPNSPSTKKIDLNEENMEFDTLDPRSPTVYIRRTPIKDIINDAAEVTKANDLNRQLEIPQATIASTLIKDKLMRHLGIDKFDPRSPSQLINRTPINFQDISTSAANETYTDADLVADDTFGSIDSTNVPDELMHSLLALNRTEPHNESQPEPNEVKVYLETDFGCALVTKISQLISADTADPRSPSDVIDRTPIVIELEELIEQTVTSPEETNPDKEEYKTEDMRAKTPQPELVPELIQPIVAPLNFTNANIFEDMTAIRFSTPKRELNAKETRTPLGCVANKPHVRSNSNNENASASKLQYVKKAVRDDVFANRCYDENTDRKRDTGLPLPRNLSKIPIRAKKSFGSPDF